MAVEVIKRGSPPSEKIYEATCRMCSSKLRFTRSDANFTDAYDQRESAYLTVACPVCGSAVTTGL